MVFPEVVVNRYVVVVGEIGLHFSVMDVSVMRTSAHIVYNRVICRVCFVD